MKNIIIVFTICVLGIGFARATPNLYTETVDFYYDQTPTCNHYSLTSAFDEKGRTTARIYSFRFGPDEINYTEFPDSPRNGVMVTILNMDLKGLSNIRFRCIPGGVAVTTQNGITYRTVKYSNRAIPNITESPCLPDGYNFDIK